MLNITNPYAGLLSSEEEKNLGQQAKTMGLLNLASAMFAAGAPSPVRQGLGTAFAQGLPAYMQGVQGTYEQGINTLLTREKIQDMLAKRRQSEAGRTALQQAYERMSGLSPQGALAMPGGQTGPTTERAAMIGQRQPMSQQEILGLAMNPNIDPETAKRILDVAQLSAPKATDLPTSVREYQFAVGQGFKGTFQDFITEQKKAGAPSTTITLPGDKKMAEVLGAKGAERLDSSFTQAQEAQSTIQNINELRPILAEGVFAGPLSAAPRAVAQIASSLGITGKDTKELLDRTAVAMQGLAKFELSAAAAMRGQGAITENERVLIQRAAGGRLDQFTAPEVQSLLTAMEKTANYRIGSHNRQLDILRRSGSPEVRDLVPFYELGATNVVSTPAAAGVKKYNPKTEKVE